MFTDDGSLLVVVGELDGRLHVALWVEATGTAVPASSCPTLSPGRTFDLPAGSPRHHALVDGWLVVALQAGHLVVAIAPDGAVVGRATLPSPSCILASTLGSA